MPLYSASAIVLRRINFSETDRIVTICTREHGKVSCIAKGSRKPISRLAGCTEVLTHARFQLAQGRNLDVITQSEIKDSFPRIHADLSRLAHASYIAELVNTMVEEEHEPNPDLFEILLSALYLLERANDPEKIMHMFELQLMKLLGYQPVLRCCARCRRSLEEGELFFSPSLGGLVCRECGPLPEDAIVVSQEAVRVMVELGEAEAPEVEAMKIGREVMNQIARVMRWYVRYRADRELKSLEFLQALRVGANHEEPGSSRDIREDSRPS